MGDKKPSKFPQSIPSHHLGQPTPTASASHTCRPDRGKHRLSLPPQGENLRGHSPAYQGQHHPFDDRQKVTLLERIDELSRQVASLRKSQNHNRSQLKGRHRSHSRDHRRCARTTLGHPTTPACTTDVSGTTQIIAQRAPASREAFACRALPPGEKLHQRTLTAANVCATSSGRLLVTDCVTKQWYLMDTGPELCVFPRNRLPWRRERIDYTLYAANGATIPTYGWISRSFNLGMRRDLTWRFVIAGLETPFIGVDLLSHY